MRSTMACDWLALAGSLQTIEDEDPHSEKAIVANAQREKRTGCVCRCLLLSFWWHCGTKNSSVGAEFKWQFLLPPDTRQAGRECVFHATAT